MLTDAEYFELTGHAHYDWRVASFTKGRFASAPYDLLFENGYGITAEDLSGYWSTLIDIKQGKFTVPPIDSGEVIVTDGRNS